MLANTLSDTEVKIGEILSKEEHRGGQSNRGKTLPKGINKKQSSQFQAMAENYIPLFKRCYM